MITNSSKSLSEITSALPISLREYESSAKDIKLIILFSLFLILSSSVSAAITAEAWINTTATQGQIFGAGPYFSSSNPYFAVSVGGGGTIVINSDNMGEFGPGGWTLTGLIPINDGVYHHVGITYSADNPSRIEFQIFIDGIFDYAENISTMGTTLADGTWYIGTAYNDNGISSCGVGCEMQIDDFVLSDQPNLLDHVFDIWDLAHFNISEEANESNHPYSSVIYNLNGDLIDSSLINDQDNASIDNNSVAANFAESKHGTQSFYTNGTNYAWFRGINPFSLVIPQCSDSADNDFDGATDYPSDFSCVDADDNDETNALSECQDGFDNDDDSVLDFGGDNDCSSLQDNSESGTIQNTTVSGYSPNYEFSDFAEITGDVIGQTAVDIKDYTGILVLFGFLTLSGFVYVGIIK